MKSKLTIFCVVFFVFMSGAYRAFAYDFSAVAPSGQTLYYNIVTGGVELTFPGYASGDNYYTGYVKPYGNLIIPNMVSNTDSLYTVVGIGHEAFAHCSDLTSVTMGSSLTYIGNDAFNDCDGLTSIIVPDNVDSIGNAAFCWCSNLSSVTIGLSVTSIGSILFLGSSNLDSVYLKPSIPPTIGYSIFSSTPTLFIPQGSLSA